MSLHFSNERTSYRFDRTLHLSTVVVLNPRFLGGGQLPAESSSLTARYHSNKKQYLIYSVTLIFDKTFFLTNAHVQGQIAILTGNCPMTGCYQQPCLVSLTSCMAFQLRWRGHPVNNIHSPHPLPFVLSGHGFNLHCQHRGKLH